MSVTVISMQCVERSRFEPEEIRGQMQSSYYSIRFGGSLLGSLAGALVSYAVTVSDR
jgi:tetrahydromethanopterin S-methyltransferase subunit E